MVKLRYTYPDGHTFVTEAMLETTARAYMPALLAVPVSATLYRAPFGMVEFIPC